MKAALDTSPDSCFFFPPQHSQTSLNQSVYFVCVVKLYKMMHPLQYCMRVRVGVMRNTSQPGLWRKQFSVFSIRSKKIFYKCVMRHHSFALRTLNLTIYNPQTSDDNWLRCQANYIHMLGRSNEPKCAQPVHNLTPCSWYTYTVHSAIRAEWFGFNVRSYCHLVVSCKRHHSNRGRVYLSTNCFTGVQPKNTFLFGYVLKTSLEKYTLSPLTIPSICMHRCSVSHLNLWLYCCIFFFFFVWINCYLLFPQMLTP